MRLGNPQGEFFRRWANIFAPALACQVVCGWGFATTCHQWVVACRWTSGRTWSAVSGPELPAASTSMPWRRITTMAETHEGAAGLVGAGRFVHSASRARAGDALRKCRSLGGIAGEIARAPRRVLGRRCARAGVDAAVGRRAGRPLSAFQVFRGRRGQPDGQPARSPPGAGRRQPARAHLGGRGRRDALLHLSDALRRGVQVRQRAEGPRRQEGRCRRHLHAEPVGSHRRRPGLLPDWRALQYRVLRLLRPLAARSSRVVPAEGHPHRR